MASISTRQPSSTYTRERNSTGQQSEKRGKPRGRREYGEPDGENVLVPIQLGSRVSEGATRPSPGWASNCGWEDEAAIAARRLDGAQNHMSHVQNTIPREDAAVDPAPPPLLRRCTDD